MQTNDDRELELIIYDFDVYMVDTKATMERRKKLGEAMPRKQRAIDRTISYCRYSAFFNNKWQCFKKGTDYVCALEYQRNCEEWSKRPQ